MIPIKVQQPQDLIDKPDKIQQKLTKLAKQVYFVQNKDILLPESVTVSKNKKDIRKFCDRKSFKKKNPLLLLLISLPLFSI